MSDPVCGSAQLSSLLSVTTTLVGHRCEINWTIKNFSELNRTVFSSPFPLEPECHTKWSLRLSYGPGYQLEVLVERIGTDKMDDCPLLDIRLQNTEGDTRPLPIPTDMDDEHPRRTWGTWRKIPFGKDPKSLETERNTLFLIDDVLIVQALILVTECCTRTKTSRINPAMKLLEEEIQDLCDDAKNEFVVVP